MQPRCALSTPSDRTAPHRAELASATQLSFPASSLMSARFMFELPPARFLRRLIVANKRIKLGLAAPPSPLDRLDGGKLGASAAGLALPLPLPVPVSGVAASAGPLPRRVCPLLPFDPRSVAGFRFFLERETSGER